MLFRSHSQEGQRRRALGLLRQCGFHDELSQAVTEGLAAARRGLTVARTGVDITCIICHEGPSRTVGSILGWAGCDHPMHGSCIRRWVATCHANRRAATCPVCRRDLAGRVAQGSDDERRHPPRLGTLRVLAPAAPTLSSTQAPLAEEAGAGDSPNPAREDGRLTSPAAPPWRGCLPPE